MSIFVVFSFFSINQVFFFYIGSNYTITANPAPGQLCTPCEEDDTNYDAPPGPLPILGDSGVFLEQLRQPPHKVSFLYYPFVLFN